MFDCGKTKKDGLYKVRFAYSAAPGHTVSLAGVFNDWDPARLPMKYSAAKKLYSCSIKLAPGNYEYKLVVDNKWLLDEGNPNFVTNDFGTLNSVIVIK